MFPCGGRYRPGGTGLAGYRALHHNKATLGRNDMRKLMTAAAFALLMSGGAVMAQETLKIGYIDPLSGGGASIGEVGLKTFQFLADEVNAKGGIQGKKVEIVP